MPNQWRRIVAVLANADQRRALADLITEHEAELSDRRRERALAQLIEAGLAINTDNGPRPDTQVLTDLLATDPPAPRTGLERYIQGGRLIQYPSKPSERLDVLAWLADQVIIDGQEF